MDCPGGLLCCVPLPPKHIPRESSCSPLLSSVPTVPPPQGFLGVGCRRVGKTHVVATSRTLGFRSGLKMPMHEEFPPASFPPGKPEEVIWNTRIEGEFQRRRALEICLLVAWESRVGEYVLQISQGWVFWCSFCRALINREWLLRKSVVRVSSDHNLHLSCCAACLFLSR